MTKKSIHHKSFSSPCPIQVHKWSLPYIKAGYVLNARNTFMLMGTITQTMELFEGDGEIVEDLNVSPDRVNSKTGDKNVTESSSGVGGNKGVGEADEGKPKQPTKPRATKSRATKSRVLSDKKPASIAE